jgi:LmbE family N-acetylglucosaminyl deacetylase
VTVAHPDDESFGTGSVIARAARLGAEVVVACATLGEAGERAPGSPADDDLGAVREGELRRAAAVLGAARVELLGYRDSGFDGPAGAGTLAGVPLEEVTRRLLRLLDDLRPHVVVVLDGSDGHRDHLRVSQAVRAALRCLPGARPALWEHTLPRSLMRRWLQETSAERGDDAYHAVDADGLGRPDADVTDVLDVAEVLELRETAIAAHRSQTSPFDGLSDDLRRAFLGTDHLVRVPLPAPGPWPEPWRSATGGGSSAQYWDCVSGTWRACPGR